MMNKNLVGIVVLILVSTSLLAACAGGASTDAASTEVQAETAVSEEAVTEQAVVTEDATETEEVETAEAATEEATETTAATEAAVSSASGVSFSNDVMPILQANCTRCHGTSRQSGGLRLNTYANLMTGSEDGQVVAPGDATNSILVQLIEAGRMPRNSGKLADGDIQLIRDWVNGGALDN